MIHSELRQAHFAWQEGYGVSRSVREYVKGQEEHHQRHSFRMNTLPSSKRMRSNSIRNTMGECSAPLVNALPPLPGRRFDLDNPGGGARSSLATGYRLLRLRRVIPLPFHGSDAARSASTVNPHSAICNQSSADVARGRAWSSSAVVRGATCRPSTLPEAQSTDNRQRAKRNQPTTRGRQAAQLSSVLLLDRRDRLHPQA
jgi:hypothetical protein